MIRTWISDANGNRCSVERWGSKELAEAALASLKGCSRCYDCSGCSDCYGVKRERPPVPKIEHIHSRLFEAVSQPESLDMSTWHTCGTTHCRAGWVVVLAGEPGKQLEEFHNTELAATLIYAASGYDIHPARFYDTNADSMEDMRKLAEAEKAVA